jgi:hypothetical protein
MTSSVDNSDYRSFWGGGGMAVRLGGGGTVRIMGGLGRRVEPNERRGKDPGRLRIDGRLAGRAEVDDGGA